MTHRRPRCWVCSCRAGGQLYAGENVKGLALLGVATAAPIIGTHLSTNAILEKCSSPYSSANECTGQSNLAPFYVGIGVSTAAWVLGFASADEAAEPANLEAGSVSLKPVALKEMHGPVRPGVQLSYRF